MKHFLYRHCTPGLYYHYLVLINQAITSQMGTKKKKKKILFVVMKCEREILHIM